MKIHHSGVVTAVLATALVLASAGTASAVPSPHQKFSPSDTSSLPVVYLSGANDLPQLNKDIEKNIADQGMKFFEWDPLIETLKGNNKLYDHMNAYAASVDAFVKDVLKKTGASKVNIITYSQSGLINQNWMKNRGGAKYVAKVINYSGILQGTQVASVAIRFTGNCLGFGTCLDFDPFGPLVTSVNKNGEALPGITYYNITSSQEEMAIPYPVNFMYAPVGNYKNVLLQDYCPSDKSGHLGLPHSPATKSITLQALRGQALNPTCK